MRWRPALLALTLAACGGAPRPDPPSGAVDPGAHGLSTPGQGPGRSASPSAAHPSDPAGALLGDLPAALPGLSAPAALPARPASPPVGEVTGRVVMTREHCEALGRKFSELTVAQGGGGGAIHREAEGVGRTFADRCAREMVGQTVEVGEYQCMLRARAAEELLGCKR